ncbi:prepilin-type N-terminal cleavage/methylation domain-containing protein [Sulfurimonas sp. MAG313]|nr:prepilin-type N-terminal cleavage/methylation domain-containing protein [Sulfurimonas sp. MAG313]MDF1880682.1 prepilin-type N-terminal cleavage/methylation domain-containing protein [Sulfurimonas sp. MAG313]
MKKGFTFLELVFVIVIMGILAKFGTNILVTTYDSYSTSTTNSKIMADVELTLKQISNRLQYRIKDSVIAGGAAQSLTAAPAGARLIEWIGYDVDGWLGDAASTNPTWSGFIDLTDGNIAELDSPGTSTARANTVIQALRPVGSGTHIDDVAIFFTGQNADVTTDFGWYVAALNSQNNVAAHKIQDNGAQVTKLVDNSGATFAGTDIYENYKLSWTAYALSFTNLNANGVGDLFLIYDYQPWAGETIAQGTQVLLLEGVQTFRFRALGETLQVQICVNNQNSLGLNDGGYSVCEEIAIF